MTRATLAELAHAGITRREWCAHWGGDEWHGDRCGCTDDRCAGYHHDDDEECGCLPVLISDLLDARRHGGVSATSAATYEASP